MRCQRLRRQDEGDCSHPPLYASSPCPVDEPTTHCRLPAERANACYGQIVLVFWLTGVSNRWQHGRLVGPDQSRGGEYSDTATRNGRLRPSCTVIGSARPGLAYTATRSPCSRSVRRSHFVPQTGQEKGPSVMRSPCLSRI